MADPEREEVPPVEVPGDIAPADNDSSGAHALALWHALDHNARHGANWFYWVAGLSVVNSLIRLLQGDVHFVIGLAATQIVDIIAAGIAQNKPEAAHVVRGVAFGIGLIVALIVMLFGWLSRKGFLSVYALGMLLYLLDGLIFVFLMKDWISAGFHAYALYGMWGGFNARRQLKALEQQLAFEPVAAEPEPAS